MHLTKARAKHYGLRWRSSMQQAKRWFLVPGPGRPWQQPQCPRAGTRGQPPWAFQLGQHRLCPSPPQVQASTRARCVPGETASQNDIRPAWNVKCWSADYNATSNSVVDGIRCGLGLIVRASFRFGSLTMIELEKFMNRLCWKCRLTSVCRTSQGGYRSLMNRVFHFLHANSVNIESWPSGACTCTSYCCWPGQERQRPSSVQRCNWLVLCAISDTHDGAL